MSRTYKGIAIEECERVKGEHPGRWTIITRHQPSGLVWSDELRPHFHSLAQAREYIDTFTLYDDATFTLGDDD